MSRRVLIPSTLPRSLPVGGGHLARAIWDFSGTTMGTYWRARVVEPDRASRTTVEHIIRGALATVVARMSPWEPDSDLGRYRTARAGTWVSLSAETFQVLARALEVAALTDGHYDPTIGNFTDALGFGPSNPANAVPPGSPAAEHARATTGYSRVAIDPTRLAIFQPGGCALDLCSIAKGFAVDLAIENLKAAGVGSCFIEIGGEARGLGCKPDGQPWWCLIEPPRGTAHGVMPTVMAACDVALATSGNTFRRHLVNPLPGHGVDTHLESVTVVASTCMEADVWATALFLLGAEAGLQLATAHGLAALFIESTSNRGHRESWSPQFAELLNE